ncbi:MAG: BBP7 family outer membrane beta-barrel protein [Pirellulales bacterium]|nr:BBP7 family outer membrane beta-barrel protein [Pirellulales bacterium]
MPILPILTFIPALATLEGRFNESPAKLSRLRVRFARVLNHERSGIVESEQTVNTFALGENLTMTNSTRMIGLIMSVLLSAAIAEAQGPAMGEVGSEVLPEFELPLPGTEGLAAPTASPPGVPAPAEGGFSAESFPAAQADCYDLSGDTSYPDVGGMWDYVAPIESTGTWLQRGFWYAETDAVVLNRMWNRNDKRYAAQDVNVEAPPVNNTNLGFNPLFLTTNRILIVSGAHPGEDASVRGTLGHFLFRDSSNRDHTMEFTAFGGANWEQGRVLSSETPNGLFVPFLIDGGNRSFDGSTRQSIRYTSDLNSFELNYRVRSRLGRDQLVMDPNGSWHRAANAGFERDYLVGLRYLNLGERFKWNAEDIFVIGDDGSYLVQTSNDLIGLQFGLGFKYQASRWSLGVKCKGGAYLNNADGSSQLNFTADDTGDADLHLSENEFSFVGECGITGRYHITPNVSWRAGYDAMIVSSVALAPNQTTFITDYSFLNTTGGPFYHGLSTGLEWYW